MYRCPQFASWYSRLQRDEVLAVWRRHCDDRTCQHRPREHVGVDRRGGEGEENEEDGDGPSLSTASASFPGDVSGSPTWTAEQAAWLLTLPMGGVEAGGGRIASKGQAGRGTHTSGTRRGLTAGGSLGVREQHGDGGVSTKHSGREKGATDWLAKLVRMATAGLRLVGDDGEEGMGAEEREGMMDAQEGVVVQKEGEAISGADGTDTCDADNPSAATCRCMCTATSAAATCCSTGHG